MASLPVELWQLIAEYALNDLVPFLTPPNARPTRPRTAVLASLSLVCKAAHLAVRDQLLADVFVTEEEQLRLLAALLEASPQRTTLPTSLNISWTAGSGGSTKRDGGKKWRAAVALLTRAAKGIRRFSLKGPLPFTRKKDKKEEPFWDPSWLEPASENVTDISLSHIRITTYPQVSHVRFPKLEVLRLVQCTDGARSPKHEHFFRHFPPLREFQLVDLTSKYQSHHLTVGFVASQAFSPSLERLTLPALPLAEALAPQPANSYQRVKLPPSLKHLTIIDLPYADIVHLDDVHTAVRDAVDEVTWLLSKQEPAIEYKARLFEEFFEARQMERPKIEFEELKDFYEPFPAQ
ncbi:hypothetical protein JCM8547_005754 [Rhodosporidiobolus lusitaniae]